VSDFIAFPSYGSVDAELRKAGLLRIVLGLVVFVRFFLIFSSYRVYMSGSALSWGEYFGMGAYLLFIVCFTAGFLTQVATALVAIGAVVADQHFSTHTLGTDVLCGVMFVFFLVNSGQRFSLDRLLLHRGGRIEKLLRPLQWFSGATEVPHIKTAYVSGFVFYALLSSVAMTYHAVDPFWTSGLTTKSLLTNSYLCKHYQLFRDMERVFPVSMSVFSIFSGIGQSIFQLFMVPLMFWRWGRRFVCLWGFSFFLISLLTINLSYLPHVELVLWALLFIPLGAASPAVQIVYDDRCNLCRGTMRTLSLIDISGSIAFLPASRSGEILASWGVDQHEIVRDMLGTVRGTVYRGYPLYGAIAKEMRLLWPVLPLLWIGSVSGLGPRVYAFIAARRRLVFGSCELGSEAPLSVTGMPRFPAMQRLMRRFCYGFFASCCALFILVEVPGLRAIASQGLSDSVVISVQRTLRFIGFEPPNVFNDTDLSMGDRWLQIYAPSPSGDWEQVSLRGKDGERLNYEGWDILNFTNHNSDFLYFGETLRLSRRMIHGVSEPQAFFGEGGVGYQSVAKRIRFDYYKRSRGGMTAYLVKLRANHSSKVYHWRSDEERFKTEVVYEALYCFDGQKPPIRLPDGVSGSDPLTVQAECRSHY
jgi:predicted DCC family thiol-disulfide oxidoreductase YuxK